MNRRSAVFVPILPFWLFVGWLLLAATLAIELGLLGIFLGLIELLLVRNGLPPANHPLRFRGEVAAVALVAAMFVDMYANEPVHTSSRGLFIAATLIVILIWSAIDAYTLPRP